jgi:pimeloyl-ACP methyl ester carboxylesterase
MQSRARWRSPGLGMRRRVEVSQGTLDYFEGGTGQPVVFIHGYFVNANVWSKVVPLLATQFRCITLDLPFAAHNLAMRPDADLSERGIIDMICDAITELNLGEVSLVGHDTGGAICQLLVTQRPQQIARLVLCSCDYRDNFPPPLLAAQLKALARWGPRLDPLIPILYAPARLRRVRRLPVIFGRLSKRPVDPIIEDTWMLPALEDADVRRDAYKVLQIFDTQRLNNAADKLGSFTGPALIAWSREDPLFPADHGRQLARELPNARLEFIDDCWALSMLEQPRRLAELMCDFLRHCSREVADR